MRNPFRRTWTEDEQKIFDFLKKLPLFDNLSEKELSVFIPFLHERNYREGEVIFFRNDPSHALYILRKGKVSLTLDVNDSTENLRELGSGSIFGENCILESTKRPMNAHTVTENASFFVIPKDSFMTVFESHPEIKSKMMESIALINENRLKKLFKFYRNSVGLFNLADIYSE